jgi:hypothetical protein
LPRAYRSSGGRGRSLRVWTHEGVGATWPEVPPVVAWTGWWSQAFFTFHPIPKYFLLHLSHQIFWRMHGVLNIGKKKIIA